MKYLPVFVAVLLLSACGSRPEPSAEERRTAPHDTAPRPAPAAEKPDPRPVIAAFGDSLSAGFGVPLGQSFPDFLQKELDKRGYGFRVANAGISGDTTSGGLSRVDSVIALKPEIVILELGGNDGLRGLPLSVTRDNLDKTIEALKAAHITVILAGMTLPPNYGPEYIKGFERIYIDLAAKHRVALIPFLLEGVATDASLMQRDRMHPTVEGNRRVATLVMRYLEPVLEQHKGK